MGQDRIWFWDWTIEHTRTILNTGFVRANVQSWGKIWTGEHLRSASCSRFNSYFCSWKMGVSRKYVHKKKKVFNTDINDTKRVKQKSTGRKIRSVVYWQMSLKQWRKTNGCKTRPWCILISVCRKWSTNQSLTTKPDSQAVRHFHYCSRWSKLRHHSADVNKQHYTIRCDYVIVWGNVINREEVKWLYLDSPSEQIPIQVSPTSMEGPASQNTNTTGCTTFGRSPDLNFIRARDCPKVLEFFTQLWPTTTASLQPSYHCNTTYRPRRKAES